MGIGPIPLSKLRDYVADELGLAEDVDEHERVCSIIRRMDDEYLSLKNAKDDKSTKGKANEIAADDPEGVRNLFRGLQARQKPKKGQAPA